MEDVARAMTQAENSSIEIRSPHRDSSPAPPCNYAWPQYQAKDTEDTESILRQMNNLRHEGTEYREKYRAWEFDKVLSVVSITILGSHRFISLVLFHPIQSECLLMRLNHSNGNLMQSKSWKKLNLPEKIS